LCVASVCLGATGEIDFGQAGQRQGDARDGRKLPVDEATTTGRSCASAGASEGQAKPKWFGESGGKERCVEDGSSGRRSE
jgi:hypothetical protein